MAGRSAKPSARFTAIAVRFARVRTDGESLRRRSRRTARGAGRSAPETGGVFDDEALDPPQNVFRPLATRAWKLRRRCADGAHPGSGGHLRDDRHDGAARRRGTGHGGSKRRRWRRHAHPAALNDPPTTPQGTPPSRSARRRLLCAAMAPRRADQTDAMRKREATGAERAGRQSRNLFADNSLVSILGSDHDRMNARKDARRNPPRLLFRLLGPGLVTGAADDDPSGIATYSQAGAHFAYGLLWTVFLTTPFMIAIQLVSAHIGRVTGKGIVANVKQFYPRPVVVVLVALLVV